MNYTLFDLFLNAYNGNSFAQLQIVQRFQPLLKKHAALLKYEDAYSDLQLYLLELLHSGKLTKLQRKDDGTLVKWLQCAVVVLLPTEHRPAKYAGSRYHPCPLSPSAAQKQ